MTGTVPTHHILTNIKLYQCVRAVYGVKGMKGTVPTHQILTSIKLYQCERELSMECKV